MKYKLIVDKGKPYEITPPNKECLFNELLKLENEYDEKQEDISFLHIIILKGNKDITEQIITEYNFKKERVGFLK
jgi:hypothetical protein